MIARLLEPVSMLDHDPGVAQDVHVPQRIAAHGDHVGELAFRNRSFSIAARILSLRRQLRYGAARSRLPGAHDETRSPRPIWQVAYRLRR